MAIRLPKRLQEPGVARGTIVASARNVTEGHNIHLYIRNNKLLRVVFEAHPGMSWPALAAAGAANQNALINTLPCRCAKVAYGLRTAPLRYLEVTQQSGILGMNAASEWAAHLLMRAPGCRAHLR